MRYDKRYNNYYILLENFRNVIITHLHMKYLHFIEIIYLIILLLNSAT